MKKFFILLVIVAMALTLTACGTAMADGGGTQEDTQKNADADVSTGTTDPNPDLLNDPTNETQPDKSQAAPQCGNTVGNISSGAFVAQGENGIYYVRQAAEQSETPTGDLVKIDADGNTSVILSGGRPSCLNIVDGWIYYINEADGLAYKVREDGTENAPLISDTSVDITSVDTMMVVDGIVYCRTVNSNRDKSICSIDVKTGTVKELQKTGPLCSGFAIYDGWIYYSNSDNNSWSTWRIRCDGTGNEQLSDDLQLYSACIENGKIYYLSARNAGPEIWAMDLDGSNSVRISAADTGIPRINSDGEWLYYSDTTAIYKMKLDGSEITKLCDFPSNYDINIDVLGDWIYLSGSGFDMQKVQTDGSQLQKVN